MENPVIKSDTYLGITYTIFSIYQCIDQSDLYTSFLQKVLNKLN